MPEVTVRQKHSIGVKSDPFTLSVEIDLDHVDAITLEMHRPGQAKQVEPITLLEADLEKLEALCRQARSSIEQIKRQVHSSLRLEAVREGTGGGK